jgi:alkylhydroperoxidase family enzyme
MTDLDYSAAAVPIRADIQAAQRYMWDLIGRPGPQWTGAQRIAIATAARRADTCALCRARKAAVSPAAVTGAHDGADTLPANAVDVVHRIRTDPGRLSRAWYESVRAAGLDEVAYVELVAVVTAVTGVDYFCRALAMPLFALPEPAPGEPSHHRPAGAKAGTAWVAMVAPEDASGPEADMYPESPMIPNIVRALSLVPDAVRALVVSTSAHYLPVAEIGNPMARPAALDRLQTELVAARVSALNQCFY